MIKSIDLNQQISPQHEFQFQEENTALVFEMTVQMASPALTDFSTTTIIN